jgi:glycogen debranching enzyme
MRRSPLQARTILAVSMHSSAAIPLIFALQMLQSNSEIARATLRTLSTLQGRTTDPEIEEEPGKIIHEYRPIAPRWLIDQRWPIRNGQLRYYGSIDATCWFLVLAETLRDQDLRAELADSIKGAAAWLERALIRGGGLLRSGPRKFLGGLEQQGWRDARNPDSDPHGGGIVRPDGSTPTAPVADTDSQAAAVAALRALASLDTERSEHWNRSASNLVTRISTQFLPDALAVEADNTPVPGAGSQLGWLLWADAVNFADVDSVARRLSQPDILTPFGLRTLSSSHPQFKENAYHRGAIWPFDNWLGWAGLRAHGYTEVAHRVESGLLAAVDQLGQAPELYSVSVRGELRSIPVANRVQAWTVGAVEALHMKWGGRS